MCVDTADPQLRFGLLWRGDPSAPPPAPERTRQHLIFAALAELGAASEPVIYADDVADAVRAKLLTLDGVLVWVDPLSEGKDRSLLDPLLRDVAAHGVWVSAHPDVILKMGTKEVLVRTRDLGWGVDTHLYGDAATFRTQFPGRLAKAGPRVLKQYRGNGGQGVWKVELVEPDSPGRARVLHALRGSLPEELALGDFMARCEIYFAGEGRIIDQAFQPRLPEGMIRCYMSGDRVMGYGRQLIKALIPPPPEAPDSEAAQPGPRIMHPPDAEPFQPLRSKMESEWVPAMQRLLDIETGALPALWDADFLLGPKTSDGQDSYVLCEINVSSVAPYPDSAAKPAAEAAVSGARRARRGDRPMSQPDADRRSLIAAVTLAGIAPSAGSAASQPAATAATAFAAKPLPFAAGAIPGRPTSCSPATTTTTTWARSNGWPPSKRLSPPLIRPRRPASPSMA
jgi:hypothetical protein